jgi:hypothetical protein
VGFLYSASETDAFGLHFKPIVVPANDTIVLDAHDATNPRIDVVYLTPTEADDQTQTRYVKNLSTGVIDTGASVDKRRRWTYTLARVAGTPAATPVAPSVPSGSIRVAEVHVPATSGSATVYDMRALYTPSQRVTATWDPPPEYTASYVPGSSTELAVNATSPASMSTVVTAGEAVIVNTSTGVKRRRYPRTTLTHSAAHATLTRYDLIVADEDGTVKIVAGTPGGALPSAGSGQLSIAAVVIVGAAASISGGAISDTRERLPVDTGALRDSAVTTAKIEDLAVTTGKIAASAVTTAKIADSNVTTAKIADSNVTTAKIADANVTGAKLSVPYGYLALTVGGETAGSERVVSIQAKDQDGVNISRSITVLVELLDGDAADPFNPDVSGTGAANFTAVTTGSANSATGRKRILCSTNASGALVLTWDDTSTSDPDDYYVKATAFNTPGIAPAISGPFGFAAGDAP